jgi:hypothetical protein
MKLTTCMMKSENDDTTPEDDILHKSLKIFKLQKKNCRKVGIKRKPRKKPPYPGYVVSKHHDYEKQKGIKMERISKDIEQQIPELTENEKYLLSIYKPYKQLLREDELSLTTPEEKKHIQELAERNMAQSVEKRMARESEYPPKTDSTQKEFDKGEESQLIQYDHSAHRNYSVYSNHITTIQLSMKTKEKLKKLGKKGDTYEDIILRLILNNEKI